MTPFIVLVGSFLLLRVVLSRAIAPLRSGVVSLRWALAAMFLLTASAHFGSRRPDLVRMVPPSFPGPELLVTLTGVAEILGAAGLLLPRVAPWAAAGLTLLLVALFPANVHAAREGLTIGGAPVTPLVPRAVLQLVFLAAVLAAGFGAHGVRRYAGERRRGTTDQDGAGRRSPVERSGWRPS
jgi:uncharacterized membrane protein